MPLSVRFRKYRAGTEDHDRSENDGAPWLCDADSGRREKFLNTKKELEAMLVVALAGRAAEEIVFDTVTTGASNDIEQATKIARAMITQYGMSDRFGLMGIESIQNKYLDGRAVLNCGEATAERSTKK